MPTYHSGSQMKFSTFNTIITTPRRKRWAGLLLFTSEYLKDVNDLNDNDNTFRISMEKEFLI